MKKRKPITTLTPKERMFVGNFVGNGDKKARGNQTESAMQAYNTKSRRNASMLAEAAMRRPRVRNEIDRLLKKHNLTDDLIFRKMAEGLDANCVSFWKGQAIQTDVADHVARHKYLQDLLKIVSAFPAERREIHQMNIDLAVEKLPPEEMRFLLQGLLKKIHVKDKTNEGEQAQLPSGSDREMRKENN